MLYDLATIQASILRLTGQSIDAQVLKDDLEADIWVPDVGRMIAVANKPGQLERSDHYGVFEGMTPSKSYKISTGRYRYARLLTPAEIAKCY